MRATVVLSCNIFFILMDTIISTVLYVRGSQVDIFADELMRFNIFQSALDLWGTLLVRVALLLGASIGVLRNRVDGPRRVSKLSTLTTLICLTIMTYALTKLLMFSEKEALLVDPWFLSLVSWSCVSAMGTMYLWGILAKTSNAVRDSSGEEETKRLVDPLADSSSEPEDEESKTFSGKHRRCKGAKENSDSRATVGRLLSYCKRDSLLLAVAFFFLMVSAVCEAFIPYYTGKAIDGIVIHQSMEHFTKPMITLAALAFVSSIAIGVRGGVFSITLARLNIRLRNLLFRSLMRQEIGFFDLNHTGDITSRLTSDTTQVSDLISLNVNLFLRSFIKAVGFFIFMFGMSWKLTLVTIMGFPYIAVVSKMYGEYYKKLTKEVQTSLAQANKVAEETISAMRTVRSFANEEQESESYYSKLMVMFQLNKKQALAYACFMWSSCISELALQVAILFYGGHLVITGQMSGGTLISFVIYELELGECLESVASVYTGLMQGVGAAEKVFEYIDREPEHPSGGSSAPDHFKGEVEFLNVSFSYPTRPDTEILKNVSFTIQPGEVTALVGPSGSGKSSCVGLLENFYTPNEGQVLLDGRPVQDYEHAYLHSQVALVGQEPVLFARSVQKNISYGLKDIAMDVVVEAAAKANAHDFVVGLPQGYETGVGEKGAQLSGGQKQRVAIARALIRKPRVLILDEATSALDSESEHIVQQALNDIMQEHTVLMIAHRLSTVERANNIIVIDNGRIVDQGTHAELMARKGLYFKLVQRQVLGIETGADLLNPPKDLLWKAVNGRAQSGEESSDSDSNVKL
ncbi:ATP-binding cassette sub-family B member 9 [Alosa sapidissima]|uniref:ATP-binding cassette sub-family B member 9 n=1 Tax=Alosa sapidissima TaxID=34773 RepID=UPI001C092FDA|nr:ATP-binding cassette sub-family B member 9 [Alosa sapidissima]